MAETVTAARHSIWRHLLDSIHASKKQESKLKFVTLDKESNMITLWRNDEFLEICSREEASEKALEVERKLPVPKHQQVRHSNNPEGFFIERI